MISEEPSTGAELVETVILNETTQKISVLMLALKPISADY
jgi:hypothetical protein